MEEEVKGYITKIINEGSPEEMETLRDLFEESLDDLRKYSEEDYKDIEMCLYEMAHGKTLTKEMAEEWVNNMMPPSKWDFATTSTVRKQQNITDIDEVSFYVVMNMLYSDMSNVLGDGDSAASVANYVQATKDWLMDEDVAEDKLYNYWKYVAN